MPYLVMIVLIIGFVAVATSTDSSFEEIKYNACKNTYTQVEDYAKCDKMEFSEFLKKIRVEKD